MVQPIQRPDRVTRASTHPLRRSSPSATPPSPRKWQRSVPERPALPKSPPRPLPRERSRLLFPFAGARQALYLARRLPCSPLLPCAQWLKPGSLRDRLLSGPLVDISVGTSTPPRAWSLHRNLLAYHSTYLARRFRNPRSADSGYGSGNDGAGNSTAEDPTSPASAASDKGKGPALTLDLPEDSPRAFELFVKWLYQGVLDDASALTEPERKWDHAFACQQLHALAERLGLRAVKNAAIDQFRRACNEAGLVPGPEEMAPVYANTLPGSPFRTLVSRIAARQIMDPDTQRDATTYKACFEASADFAVDLVNEMRQGGGGKLLGDPTEDIGCFYHEHEDGEDCPSKSRSSNGNGILKYDPSLHEF